jgi:hypothetical protein
VWNEIKEYAPEFLGIFSENPLVASYEFINDDIQFIETDNQVPNLKSSNIYKAHDLEIEVTSVHAVKGQTHCATLYLESFYQGSYVSNKLSSQFLGNFFNDRRVYHKESTKMAYVGFSRPTNLLCVAIHKDRFDECLNSINTDKWEIVEVQAIT